MVARQCGDFWTIIYPISIRPFAANSCKFRDLAWQPGIAGRRQIAMPGSASLAEVATDLSFVLACATGCFFLIAVSLRFATKHSRRLDSLSANAYGLYLVHYNFVVWLQYALLGTALFAMVKVAIVFGGTLVLSWIAVLAVQRISFGARLIGAPRRAVAMS
jgi:hypothetical protein